MLTEPTINPLEHILMHFKGSKTSMFSQIFNKIIDTPVSFDSRNLDRILLFEEIYQNLEMGYSIENLEYTTFCLMYFWLHSNMWFNTEK